MPQKPPFDGSTELAEVRLRLTSACIGKYEVVFGQVLRPRPTSEAELCDVPVEEVLLFRELDMFDLRG